MDQREALEELFTTSLDAFVETRTRLAAALLAQGHKDEGQALKKMRRPSPSAWATNQIVRRARPELDAFLGASDRLRASQGAIVAGVGDRGVYQADVDDLRRATAALTAAARRILEELGRPDDRALVDRVVANARTAALTEPGRQALLGGELVADVAGDDAFGGLLAGGAAGPPTPRATNATKPVEAPPPAPSPDARKRAQEAREQARARELESARLEETEARQAAASTAVAATRAREALEAARGRLEDAQQAAREAERALREAEAAQGTVQRAAAEAETRAGRAIRRREALEK